MKGPTATKIFFTLFTLLTVGRAAAQTCTANLYLKDLQINTPKADFLLPLPGGGVLLGGMSYNQISHVSVVKTNPDGNVLLNKEVSFPLYSNVTKAALTPTHKLMIAHGPALALLDTSGNFLGGATADLSFGRLDLMDMKLDAAGNAVVLYRDAWSTPYAYVLAKFSFDLSNLLWSQRFYKYSDYFRGILADGDKVLVCGQYNLNAADTADGTLICFNNNTGAFVKQVCYTLDGYRTGFNTVHKIDDGYLLEGFHAATGVPYSTSTHSILRLDTALQPVKAVRFATVLNIDGILLSANADGSYYGVREAAWGLFFSCNARDSVLWTRGQVGSRGFGVEQLARTANNLYALEASCWTLYKTDMNGRVGNCAELTQPFISVPLAPAVIAKTPMTIAAGGVSRSSASFAVTDRPFQTVPYCTYTSSCSSLQVIGSTAVCTSGGAVFYKGRRNAACRLPVQWEITGAPTMQDRLNDSTISVNFLQSGTYRLIGSVTGNCAPIADTLTIQVTLTSQVSLDLGPDRELCAGNALLLNAHKGYASYLWQDGSNDSTFAVTQPGLYHVTVTDACGNIFKDSVNVTAAPPVAFTAGPDRTKCNTDTLHLSAPSGFLNYTWSNNYNISSLTSANVVVNPLVDTAYWVKAEKTPGCFAYDTVRITVHHSPLIDLGLDKNFCAGDSALFDAGSGFQSYAWSNAQTVPQIVVKTAGTYSVAGTTAQGCRSFDTVRVLNVYSLPLVHLDKGTALCFGESKTLDAGVFASYAWNTGAVAQSITVNSIGQYAVTVADANGCRASDTATITVIHPLPQGFLPTDTAVCSYGTVELKPATAFRNYLWSTGSAASSIAVSQPGLYWLDVRDNNACKGRDSVVVYLKQCATGFYAPSAFTPNGDYKNDIFKPVIFGVVKNYRLLIYNRWGQIVFQTTDVQRAWDGKIAGVRQATGAYVWLCTYQLEGEAEKAAKGTVMILR